MLLENLLGSTTKVKILRLLFEYPNRDFTTDEVLKNAFVGRGYAGKCLKTMLGSGVLVAKKIRRERRYSLNKGGCYFSELKELFRKERERYHGLSYLHRGLVADIGERLDRETVILFGSVAAGTATPESDVDLLIISDRKQFVHKACKSIGMKYRIAVQPVVMNGPEIEKRIKEGSMFLRNIGKEKMFIRGDEALQESIERA